MHQEFYKKEFGIKSKDMFLPDCSFSQVMPTLGHHCGLIGFSTQKLSWRTEPLVGDSKTPFPIGLWEGVDGAQASWWRSSRDAIRGTSFPKGI